MIWLAVWTACGTPRVTPPHPPAEEPIQQMDRSPTPPIPPDDVVQTLLVQGALDHPGVQHFLHLDVDGHLPLSVHAPPELAEGLGRVVIGGQPVAVAAAPSAARVRLTARERRPGPRVRIHLEIPAEGVVGWVELELADYVWSAVDAELSER